MKFSKKVRHKAGLSLDIKLMKGRVLVIGGAGFVPSHLIELILSKGLAVLALDNFVTGSFDNIAHLEKQADFEFRELDVSKPYKIEGAIEFVLHLASPASPIDYLQIPLETLCAGSFATHFALDIAKEKGARFLFASTSEVYGDPEVHPQPESYWGNVHTTGPRGCYDEAKRYGEAVVMAYHRTHQLETRIVRIFNTYGPRMRLDDGRVVPSFISQILEGNPMSVFGDGSQTRSFCYVSDLVEGIWKLLLSDCSQPVNIGNPTELTILEFGKAIAKQLGRPAQFEFKPLPEDDPKVRCPDISLANQLLDWQPQVSLEVGMEKTIQYFKQKLGMV